MYYDRRNRSSQNMLEETELNQKEKTLIPEFSSVISFFFFFFPFWTTSWFKQLSQMNGSETNIPHTSSILIFVGKESKYVLFDHVGKLNLQSLHRQVSLSQQGFCPVPRETHQEEPKHFFFSKSYQLNITNHLLFSRELPRIAKLDNY